MEPPEDAIRRPPTAAEARALAHPTRLRIVFACRERAKTNKDLAEELGTTPGTIHYHLRPLLEEGFLVADEPRPGPRGSREQPYRSTGKTWEISGTAQTSQALRQVGVEEVLAAREEDVLSLSRLGVTLPDDALAELMARFQSMLEEAKAMSVPADHDGLHGALTSATIFLSVHRRPGESSDDGYDG